MEEYIYKGILPTSAIHKGAKKKFHSEEVVRGRKVKYWHVWVRNPDYIPPPFKNNKLNKDKIRKLDKIFNSKKNKYK